jgi:hypothetical protein
MAHRSRRIHLYAAVTTALFERDSEPPAIPTALSHREVSVPAKSLSVPSKIALETLWGQDLLFGRRETDAVITMPAFVPQRVYPSYHFDIRRSRQGYWIARDRGGLAGGTFRTYKDAVRFAMFETGGDRAHVHSYPEP